MISLTVACSVGGPYPIVPKHTGDTPSPVLPNRRYRIITSLVYIRSIYYGPRSTIRSYQLNAVFFNPAVDAVIEPIPELCDDAPAYRPFAWGEFIAARVNDNYADLGAEDTQVSHFRVPAHG